MTALIIQSPPIECYSCNTVFWMAATMYKNRRDDHRNFVCPNGHNNHYPQETPEERAIRERDEARAQRDKAWVERDRAEREKETAQKKLARSIKRHANGVCEWCNRSFSNVARHMKTKHPDKVPV